MTAALYPDFLKSGLQHVAENFWQPVLPDSPLPSVKIVVSQLLSVAMIKASFVEIQQINFARSVNDDIAGM